MKDLSTLYRKAKPALEALEAEVLNPVEVDFDGLLSEQDAISVISEQLESASDTHSALDDIACIAQESLTDNTAFKPALQAVVNKHVASLEDTFEGEYHHVKPGDEKPDTKTHGTNTHDVPTNNTGLKAKLKAAWEHILKLLNTLLEKIKALYKRFFSSLTIAKKAANAKLAWLKTLKHTDVVQKPAATQWEENVKGLDNLLKALKSDIENKSRTETETARHGILVNSISGLPKREKTLGQGSGWFLYHKTNPSDAMHGIQSILSMYDTIEAKEKEIAEIGKSLEAFRSDSKAITDSNEQKRVKLVITELTKGFSNVSVYISHILNAAHTVVINCKLM